MLGRDAAFLGCDSSGQQVAEGGLVSLGIVGAYQHRNGGLLFLGRPPWQFQAASLKQELDYIGGVQWPFGLNMLTSLSVTSRG